MVDIIGNHARALLMHRIWRANLMYAAYKSDLSDRGQELARVTQLAKDDAFSGSLDTDRVAKFQAEVLEHWPNPYLPNIHTGGNKNWFNWFNLREFPVDEHLIGISDVAKGCLFPCDHCGDENFHFWTNVDSAPVIVQKMLSASRSRNELVWEAEANYDLLGCFDPFLGIHFDGYVALGMSISSRFRMAALTRGVDPIDYRGLNALKRFVNLPKDKVNLGLSFHLALAKPNLIEAIYNIGGGDIPFEFIDALSSRYALSIRVLGSRLSLISLFDNIEKNVFERISGAEDEQIARLLLRYHEASVQAFDLAMRKAGASECLDRSQVYSRPISSEGFGSRFGSRIYQAWMHDSRCIRSEKEKTKRRSLPYPNYAVGNAPKYSRILIGYTSEEVEGLMVVVRDPFFPRETLVNTRFDFLWPNDDVDYIVLMNQISQSSLSK
jgi:hypothetical protein